MMEWDLHGFCWKPQFEQELREEGEYNVEASCAHRIGAHGGGPAPPPHAPPPQALATSPSGSSSSWFSVGIPHLVSSNQIGRRRLRRPSASVAAASRRRPRAEVSEPAVRKRCAPRGGSCRRTAMKVERCGVLRRAERWGAAAAAPRRRRPARSVDDGWALVELLRHTPSTAVKALAGRIAALARQGLRRYSNAATGRPSLSICTSAAVTGSARGHPAQGLERLIDYISVREGAPAYRAWCTMGTLVGLPARMARMSCSPTPRW